MSLEIELDKRERCTVTGYQEVIGTVKAINIKEGGEYAGSDITVKKAGESSEL
jgi:hypothetical protein